MDFYITELERKILIQASYSLEDSDTREREIKSLSKAMEEQMVDVGYIFTNNNAEEIVINNKTIKVIPFWREILNI